MEQVIPRREQLLLKKKKLHAGKPKIALVMKSLANEFFSTMAEGAKAHQASHADQYDLLVNGIKDERDVTGTSQDRRRDG